MLDNNHNNLACGFDEMLIDVLYGEIDAHDKAKFDLHLQNCASCNRELTDFGATRNAVFEWRETEFATLETPKIVVPYTPKPFATKIETPRTVATWREFFDIFDLRKFWLQGSIAFAAIMICAILFVIVSVLSNNSREIAGIDKAKPLDKTIVATNLTNTISQTETLTQTTPKLENEQTDLPKIAVKENRPKSDVKDILMKNDALMSTPKRIVVKIVDEYPKPEIRQTQQKARVTPTKKFDKTPNVKQSQPNLSVLPEEADDEAIPQLTDLLDEVSPAS